MSYDIAAYMQPKMLPIPSLDDNSLLPPPPSLPWPPPGFPTPKLPAAAPPAVQAPPPGTTSDKLICDPFFGGCINKETGETLPSATPWSAIFNFIKDPRNILWAMAALIFLTVGLFALFTPEIKGVVQVASNITGRGATRS